MQRSHLHATNPPQMQIMWTDILVKMEVKMVPECDNRKAFLHRHLETILEL